MLGRITIELFLKGLGEYDGDPHRTLLGQPAKFEVSHD